MATKALTREVMTVAQISKPSGDFELVERQIPHPGTREVRIKIQACGFAELTGVRPMIETYPLEKAAKAYARMLSGDAQFRVIMTM
jgi:D-arabinose 1-dehydrogenase-like Zn-dependent alcohol dehydrogenase